MRLRVVLAAALTLALGRVAIAQDAAPVVGTSPSTALGETSFLVENLTRGELWRFFEPKPSGGTGPDYMFISNRSTLGARYRGPRWGLRGAIQYVRLENLPARAIGPGLLGTGAAYFLQAGGTFSYQFYLRSLSAAFTDPESGAWLEAGRFSRAAAEEPASGDGVVDALTRTHLNGRLLGDMEWSMYQRAWDGVRGGIRRSGWRATVTAASPTQGTFEESANLTMDRLRVGALEVHTRAGTVVPHTAIGVFGYLYDDRRRVTARPDNHPPAAGRDALSSADVRLGTVGASVVATSPRASGRFDGLVWAAVQMGDWYGQRHRAWSATGQAGHQWTGAPWQPWLRAGFDYASGDGSASDDAHGTFFSMLPSGNQLSRSNTYALMNVVDGFVDARLSPASALEVVTSVHRVRLATASDRWYTGSGATARAGNYFGFQARASGGARRLGTLVESEVAWRATRRWTLRGYVGRMAGGDVVRNLFAGNRLITAWVESLLSF